MTHTISHKKIDRGPHLSPVYNVRCSCTPQWVAFHVGRDDRDDAIRRHEGTHRGIAADRAVQEEL